jgi:virginiamycin B lyase
VLALVVLASSLTAAAPGWADVHGTVIGPGGTLPGAIVTMTSTQGLSNSTYSDGNGRFALPLPSGGGVVASGRSPGLAIENRTLVIDGNSVTLNATVAANPLKEVSAANWLSLLPDGNAKRRFILTCGGCHEQSYSRVFKDGHARTAGEWSTAIELMKKIDAYKMIPESLDTTQYAGWLAKHLSVAAVASLQPVFVPGRLPLGHAILTEYPLPVTSDAPHDVAIGPDHRLWITAFFSNEVWALDPRDGAIERFPVTADGTPAADVRALTFDKSGHLWVVLGAQHAVVRLDPRTREFRTFPVGLYAHDVVLDSRGDVWLNDYLSKPERIAKLEVDSGRVTYFALPPSNLSAKDGSPLPYGLQIDARDRLWSTQIGGNTLVSFDTRTGATKLYRMPAPLSGPRRHAIAADGVLWIPEYSTGFLTRFDPRTEKFTRIYMGNSALGAYDVAVNPTDGSVWIAAALASAVLRFDPRTSAFEKFPLPTEPAFLRHLAIDPVTGVVWGGYSSYPAVAPNIVRI